MLPKPSPRCSWGRVGVLEMRAAYLGAVPDDGLCEACTVRSEGGQQ